MAEHCVDPPICFGDEQASGAEPGRAQPVSLDRVAVPLASAGESKDCRGRIVGSKAELGAAFALQNLFYPAHIIFRVYPYGVERGLGDVDGNSVLQEPKLLKPFGILQ